MRLIVNADDFGYSQGQNYGIIDAFQNGIVRSASLMAVGKAVHHAVALARSCPDLGIGVHLVLDYGRPVSEPSRISSLLAEDGAFLRLAFEGFLKLDPTEVEREWRAQVNFVLEQGLEPDHLDGHHHFHLHPQLFSITCKLAREFNLAIRTLPPDWELAASEEYDNLATVRHPDVSLVDFYGPGADEGFFTNFFAAHPSLRNASVEIMCHPAYVDDFILAGSSYNYLRARELQILKSQEVHKWVAENGIQLIKYSQL